jgi:hypothetical protein
MAVCLLWVLSASSILDWMPGKLAIWKTPTGEDEKKHQ